MTNKIQWIKKLGDNLASGFYYIALFFIVLTIIWSAVYHYLDIIKAGHPSLEDILMLFIYLELGSMVAVYFKTHHLSVQFLIYIAITALSRHLVIDVQEVNDTFHLYLLIGITVAIAILSFSIALLAYSNKNYGPLEKHYHDASVHKTDR